MTTPNSSQVRDLRNQIAREFREIVAEIAARCMVPRKEPNLAAYRARRAAEFARWNHWPAEVEWAIARDEP
jgi:hypothetical protein